MTKQLREAFDILYKYYNTRNNSNYNILNTICLSEAKPTKECLTNIIIKKGDYVGSLKCFHEEHTLPSFMGTHLSVYSILGIGTPVKLDKLLHIVVYSPEGNACRKYRAT